MNHDWLLFLILGHLLLVDGERKLKKKDWTAGLDMLFALACLVVGVLHLFGAIHD
jgi:hypothetical protein